MHSRDQRTLLGQTICDPQLELDETVLGDDRPGHERAPPSPGFLIAGRYRLDRLLGEGGMGRVFLVRDLHREARPVALKELLAGSITAEQLESFRDEFQVMTRVQHPHLVRVHDFGVIPRSGEHYFTMDWIDGQGAVAPTEGASWEFLESLLRQVCHALEALHDQGILHLDLKGDNILVSEGQAFVADFGLARVITTERDGVTFRGTPSHISPEMVTGDPLSPATDLYSLGIAFYEMVTRTLPFRRESLEELLLAHLRDVPPPPESHRRDVPEHWRVILGRLLAKDPGERYASAREVIAALPGSAAIELRQSELRFPFLGRSRELEVGRSLWRRTRQAREPLLLRFAGPTGVGRTRLLTELRYRLQLAGAHVLDATPNLASLSGRVELLLGEAGQSVAKGSLSEQILTLGSVRPVAVLVDDVEELPADDWRELQELAGRIVVGDAPGSLLLVAVEDSQGRRALTAGSSERAHLVEVPPLDDEEMTALLDRVLGDARVLQPIGQAVLDSSGGLPGRLLRLLEHARAQGKLVRDGWVWRAVELDDAVLDLPDEVERITAACSELSLDARRLAAELLASPGALPESYLQEVMEDHPLASALDELRLAHLAHGEARGWKLLNSVVREGVGRWVPAAALELAHDRLAARAMTENGDGFESLRHGLLGSAPEEHIARVIELGSDPSRRLPTPQMEELYRVIWQRARPVLDPGQRRRTLEQLAICSINRAELEQTLEYAGLLEADSEIPLDERVVAQTMRAAVARRRGRPEESEQVLRQALEQLDGELPHPAGAPARVELITQLATHHLHLGDLEAARGLLDRPALTEALASLGEKIEAGLAHRVDYTRCLLHFESGQFERARDVAARILEERKGHATGPVRLVCALLAAAQMELREFHEARATYQTALGGATSTPDFLFVAELLLGLAEAEQACGDLEDARSTALRAVDLGRAAGSRGSVVEALAFLAAQSQHLGDAERALAHAEQALQEAVTPAHTSRARRCLVAVLEELGEIDRRASLLEAAREEDDPAPWVTEHSLILAIDRGELDQAAAGTEALGSSSSLPGHRHWALRARLFLAQSDVSGDGDDAISLLDEVDVRECWPDPVAGTMAARLLGLRARPDTRSQLEATLALPRQTLSRRVRIEVLLALAATTENEAEARAFRERARTLRGRS